MDGLFVFDQQNDIIFTQLNDKFKGKLCELAKKQELIPNDAVRFQSTFLSFSIEFEIIFINKI